MKTTAYLFADNDIKDAAVEYTINRSLERLHPFDQEEGAEVKAAFLAGAVWREQFLKEI